jgi:hypothetical protein
MTTWSPSPDADGKFCVSKVTAACESVFGRLKLPPKSLPPAGYTIISDSSATGDSWGSFSGTGIWFTGHGYNGQIGALSSFQIPGFSLSGNTVEITLTPQ